IRDFHVTGVQTCALPISLVLAVGLAIAIERWLFLSSARRSNRQAFERILPLLQKRDYSAVMATGKASANAPIARIICAGVARMRSEERRVGERCRSWISP